MTPVTAMQLPQSNEEAWTLAGAWGSGAEMNPFEALMWRAESDPRLRSPVMVVYLLDCVPDWDRLVAAHEWGTRLIPRAREKVVDPPLHLGAPTWIADPDFDLHYHLRRVQVASGGSLRAVLELAEQIAMTPFDRARPPWEAVVVEGVEGGRGAYIFKIHHSVTDGQGGIQLLTLLHSRTREPSPDKPTPELPPPERTTPLGVLSRQLVQRTLATPKQARRLAGDALDVAGHIASRPGDALSGALRFARSLQRVLTPPPAKPSPLLGGRSLSWRFGVLEAGLDELKRAGRAAGGTLNDAYIAALLGGFRLYHDRLGTPVAEIPIAIPITLRSGDHPMGGNRFAGARFAAPVGEPDPVERVRLIHDFVVGARAEPAIDALGLLAPALNLIPAPLVTRWYAGQTANLDLQASNVPGLPYTAYIAGARIERMYPFGPLPGCAVMATLLSYTGVCAIGINLDPAAVTDPELFTECAAQGLDEVLDIGRPQPAATSAGDGGRAVHGG